MTAVDVDGDGVPDIIEESKVTAIDVDGDGVAVPADLWTTGFTPRELRLLARIVGLQPLHVFGVTPGD